MTPDLFGELLDQAGMMSSPAQMQRCQAYEQLREEGDAVVPQVLTTLEEGPEGLYIPLILLLGDITGKNPAKGVARGDVEGRRQAWLQWGGRRGHLG